MIGAGYVGIPTAVTLAHLGHDVTLADVDESRIEMLERGRLPIVEEGLAELVRASVSARRLRFVHGCGPAAEDKEVVFLCVPTPQGADGSADLSYVESAAKEIAPVLAPGAIVVTKSTVPVGSALLVERALGRADVRVASNPEFLREGSAVADSLLPDRVVVGADDQAAASRVAELFAGLGAPVIITDPTTAETIKYAANAFLATKLSFVNAVSGLCEAIGADARDVMLGIGYDHRIGFDFLKPGPGWGGSCLPKDTRALIHISESAGYDFPLLRGAVDTNDRQQQRVVAKITTALGGDLGTSTVAVWGLTFKAGTDDRRSSPAVAVAQQIRDLGATVRAFDPTVAMPDLHGSPADGPPEDLQGLVLCDDAYDACRGADVLVVLTEWEELRWLDFIRVRDTMARAVVVDARNHLDPAALRRMGFAYSGLGRA